MSIIDDILRSALPIVSEWPTLSLGSKIGEAIKLLLEIGGLWEFFKFCRRRIFQRKTWLEEKNEVLEEDNHNKRQEIDRLKAEIFQKTQRLPETVVAKAEREWRDHNEDSAIRELETWFRANGQFIGDVALHIAKFHISRSIPDPTGHLHEASRMLRLAQAASPQSQEARELWSEFDIVNASLQEQLIRSGETQIAWNKEMSSRLREKGEELLPVIQTLRDVAIFCFNDGHRRLARRSPRARRHTGRGQIVPRHPDVLTTRKLRAQVLSDLGRYGDALAEIDAFSPIQVEVQGARHPAALRTNSLKFGIEIVSQSNVNCEENLRDIINALVAATGHSAKETLRARYRLSRRLFQRRRAKGMREKARLEIIDTIGHFDPLTDQNDSLLRAAHALLALIEGHSTDEVLIV